MYYQNAMRATVDLFRGIDTASTLLAVAQPLADSTVASASLLVEWYSMGPASRGVQVFVDGTSVGNSSSSPFTVDLSRFRGHRGAHNLVVQLVDGVTRYGLSVAQLDVPGAYFPTNVTMALDFEF